ncbi:WcbI family polysaccharide biosynthesis putative acetyltransferase [Roseomonas sp. CCTCC AB2023176]|uniref:WcbI family polysaccharide biosynthesis putative acetyltransferase n=1 Tax=Roseomonas sp. CCTCC AB2023176 TaxID=3342640 RepID=UPI0035DB2FB2
MSATREAPALADLPPDAPQAVLPRMDVGRSGRRLPDGSVVAGRRTKAGSLLFGPFLRLDPGRYRLMLTARAERPRLTEAPVLGLEVIALAQLQRAWRDATGAELSAGPLDIVFTVPPDLSKAEGRDIPFEFRVWHHANADIAVEGMTLAVLQPGDAAEDTLPRWRLLGRLHPSWLHPHRGGGTVAARAWPVRRVATQCSPRLRLPAGDYRLILRAAPGAATDRPALRAEALARDGTILASRDFTEAALRSGDAVLGLTLPADLALDTSQGNQVDLRLTRLRVGAPALTAADLEPAAGALRAPDRGAPAILGTARANLVIIGNCQAGMIANVFGNDDALHARFAARHHHHALAEPLHEAARRELEAADIVLMQDIRDNDAYPLRDAIPPAARMVTFPCLRLASPWPFDGYNGAGDPDAFVKDYPNHEFDYLDGLLARLRREVPDPGARFVAYRDLSVRGLVNPQRLHRLEERRLIAMDAAHGVTTGALILERVQREQVFYTTGHPNGRIFTHLLEGIVGLLGVRERLTATEGLDGLRTLQVPVHPVIAEKLGLRWAGPDATYLYRGERITWETYIRRYIAYYG